MDRRGTSDGLSFGWQTVAELIVDPALDALILNQYEEFSHLKGRVPLAVDYERMAELEKMGMFRVWTARLDKQLVGIIEFQIVRHLHSRNTIFAVDHGHYLDPDARAMWRFIAMWRSALVALRELGVEIVMAHDNARHPLGPAMRRLGFSPDGSTWMKAL
jgi:hypothetical protein